MDPYFTTALPGCKWMGSGENKEWVGVLNLRWDKTPSVFYSSTFKNRLGQN